MTIPTRTPPPAADRQPVLNMAPRQAPTAPVAWSKPHEIGKRVLLYGVGGMGKTTFASRLPGARFIDLDKSLASIGAEIPCVTPADWSDFRSVIKSCSSMKSGEWLVIDSCTPLQNYCEHWVLANVRTDKGAVVRNIEGYGYGKGFRHVYDEWGQMLIDIDAVVEQKINVCFIAHSSNYNVANVEGDDYKRIEPRLQDAGDGGKSSIKEKMRDWADFVLCVREEVVIDESGKAQGCGTRALYSSVNPHCMAKSRRADGSQLPPLQITADNGAEVWQQILN